MAEKIMLAWDTSTDDGVVAIGREGRLVAESRFRTVKGHAGWLMPLVDELMRSEGMGPRHVGALAAGIGPGGFTGVKVGVATAKAMALALDVPLAGMTTIDLMAAHAPAGTGPLLACIDAKQGLVYAAGYAGPEPGAKRLSGYVCVPPAEAGVMAAGLGEHVTIVGYMPEGLAAAAQREGATVREVRAEGFPSGELLVRLAAARIASGDYGDAVTVAPVYLKKPV